MTTPPAGQSPYSEPGPYVPPMGSAPASPSDPTVPGPPAYATGEHPPQHSEPTTPTRTAPAAGFDDRGHVRRGRVSVAWVAMIAAAVVLVLLIIFIAQNSRQATIHYLGGSGSMSLGLIVLVAAVVGVLLAAIPGSIRILQLRRALKRNTPKDQRTP